MRLLAIPQWSFGRDRRLLTDFEEILKLFKLDIHDLTSDVDQNRTVSAYSGDPVAVFEASERLCVGAFARIDLQRQTGTFPRIGALDVLPFIPLGDIPSVVMHRYIDQLAWTLADFYKIPVFLYEKSERERSEDDLSGMRKRGFGALADAELVPDYGPAQVHPHLGVLVMGWRDFQLTINLNLKTEKSGVATALASRLRQLRTEGDERFLGVRVLPMARPSLGQCQLHLNITMPDLTPIDPMVEWARVEASHYGVVLADTVVVGVIRQRDLSGATRVSYRPEQVLPP